jgi:hypothetical protein
MEQERSRKYLLQDDKILDRRTAEDWALGLQNIRQERIRPLDIGIAEYWTRGSRIVEYWYCIILAKKRAARYWLRR